MPSYDSGHKHQRESLQIQTTENILANFKEIDKNNFIFVKSDTFTKLEIRRACRQLNIENKLDLLLNSSETFKNDWQDAQIIDLSDTVLLQALQLGNFTTEEIDKIKETIKNGTV
jgi:hypothetical protein